MLLTFDRGDARKPRGHALLYFRSWADSSAVFATYLIVPPISVDIAKYIPPMFAAQFQQLGQLGRAGSVFPYPPIPEKVESYGLLERMARARDDDLIFGGSVDASSPERLLHATAEAAQQYSGSYSAYAESISTEPETTSLPEETGSVGVSEILYGLMSERDRLAELSKLSGQLRYAVSGKDSNLLKDTVAEIERLASYLPEKYKVSEVLLAAQRPGPEGDRLTRLYLERAYKLASEDYEGLSELEEEIQQLK